ncbi:hypothetical protein TNIN_66021 [Trichonephila inaurata madagascariensis]|uniref:Uncharacterized protein n=1 Tax=Trichonephila inaurata madagascariensis TaxID=2747483 RepID=A0A8X7C3E4_9ARAC|nr:hypothetical protein TNIN_66021 [Trichonephila inaurata madagascariensis]
MRALDEGAAEDRPPQSAPCRAARCTRPHTRSRPPLPNAKIELLKGSRFHHPIQGTVRKPPPQNYRWKINPLQYVPDYPQITAQLLTYSATALGHIKARIQIDLIRQIDASAWRSADAGLSYRGGFQATGHTAINHS